MSELETRTALIAPTGQNALNERSLANYLEQEGNVGKVNSLSVKQFSHGQSNPTYFLQVDGRKYVLRKKPAGKILASAHAVDREYQVLKALQNTPVPVPTTRLLCTDPAVLGTPFYIMDHVQGTVFVDPSMPSASPQQRRSAYEGMAKTLAALHSQDFRALGLEEFGRHSGYCSRQVWRWGRQYAAQLSGPPLPEMQQLIQWLETHIPDSDADSTVTRISHGDYRPFRTTSSLLVFLENVKLIQRMLFIQRLDNLILAPEKNMQVLAVLDWELSTLGHPVADLAYSAMPYRLPRGSDAVQALPEQLPQGIPTETEYIEMYSRARGIPVPDTATYNFCMVLSIFRIAAIIAGVGARAKLGNASSSIAARVGSEEKVKALARRALDIVARNPSPPTSRISQSESLLSRMNAHQPVKSDHVSEVHGMAQRVIPAGSASETPADMTELVNQVSQFMEREVLPAEVDLEQLASTSNRWTIHPRMEELKKKAQAKGLWNLWISKDLAVSIQHLRPRDAQGVDEHLLGKDLTNLQYAYLSEIMGRAPWASEVFNCSAPDTGNMEVLARYGSHEQQEQWLLPLLRGEIRSCFAMTEPDVASSDARNIQSSIQRSGDSYIVNGRKWWTSGAMDPRCKISVFMGKSNPEASSYKQQSMILVPMDTPGVQILRPLTVLGYDDAPHGHAEVDFKNVRVPEGNMLLGEGRGFEIAQGRLGPGRLHHCMRLIGMGQRSVELMGERALSRRAFGKSIAEHGAFASEFAQCIVKLNAARLTVLDAADFLDKHGNKKARQRIAYAKVLAPQTVLSVIDQAMQVHGGAGLCDDFPLAKLYAQARTIRLADGPDDVHLASIAKLELAKMSNQRASAKL